MRPKESEASLGSRPARLVIADHYDLFRESLRMALEGEADLKVVGEAKDGREALEVCRELRPDLVLMDVRMPRVDGLEATRAIKEELPSMRVVIVTLLENPDYLSEAMQAGAGDYVLKDVPLYDVVSAVRRVLSGEHASSDGSPRPPASIDEIVCLQGSPRKVI